MDGHYIACCRMSWARFLDDRSTFHQHDGNLWPHCWLLVGIDIASSMWDRTGVSCGEMFVFIFSSGSLVLKTCKNCRKTYRQAWTSKSGLGQISCNYHDEHKDNKHLAGLPGSTTGVTHRLLFWTYSVDWRFIAIIGKLCMCSIVDIVPLRISMILVPSYLIFVPNRYVSYVSNLARWCKSFVSFYNLGMVMEKRVWWK